MNDFQGHQNFQEKDAKKWENRFAVSLGLTWFIPLIVFALQIVSVGSQLSFDITELSNWTNLEQVFTLPIRTFILMVTITTLLGLYSRSIQLSEQLRLSRLQQNLAFEQLKLTKKQSERLEVQLNLTLKKDNYMLYQEHKKQFNEHLNDLLKVSKEIFRLLSPLKKEILIIYREKLYKSIFPENDSIEVKNVELKSDKIIFSHDFYPIQLDVIKNLKPGTVGRELEGALKTCIRRLTAIGININCHTNDSENFDINIFAVSLMRAISILHGLGLIEQSFNDELVKDIGSTFKSVFH